LTFISDFLKYDGRVTYSGFLMAKHGTLIMGKNEALLAIASMDISLEFDMILNSIVDITCVAMNAPSGTMMLVEEETGVLRISASYGLGHEYIERIDKAARNGVSLSSGPQGTAFETGTGCHVSNIFKEPGSRPWYDISRELGFSSQIYAPMKIGTKTTGLLNVHWAKPRQFTDDEINFVTAAASQAAIVVQNAQICAGLKMNIKELKESETKYRRIFENANDSFYIHDAEGYFKEVNKSIIKLLGCTKEELIGTHMSQWITPQSQRTAQIESQKGPGCGPGEQQMVLDLICKNGEHRLMEIRRHLVREGSRITAIYGIGRDITEKTKLEQQLKDYTEKLTRSCEELIETDRTKTEFISNISHELLTPLTSIKGFTELLRDETSGNINEVQKKKLDTIYRNTEKLIRLIRELLEVAHLEKNKFGLHFGLVSMNDIITRSIQNIHPQVKDKEISIIPEIKRLPRIWGDEERLTLVVTNLLTNAIKFTPRKGRVTINADEDTKDIKISVTDTGIGIPDDKLTRIFEKFYQIDGSLNRKYGGVGLGLSVCKSIIESHYGSIWAESTGSGSTFNIVLPKLTYRKDTGL
jgi:PAS domain S-box-containing protein